MRWDMILAAGFDAVEAANADEAIEILENRTDITVVFTDIQMPGSMDGLKLAQAVRGRWPPINMVTTSGRVDVRETDLPDGGRFLPKPYSPAPDCRHAARIDLRGVNSRAHRHFRGANSSEIPEIQQRTPASAFQGRAKSASLNDRTYAMISGVIWSSMKAMRSRSCSLRFFRRCSRSKSGAAIDAGHRSPRPGRGVPAGGERARRRVRAHLRRSWPTIAETRPVCEGVRKPRWPWNPARNTSAPKIASARRSRTKGSFHSWLQVIHHVRHSTLIPIDSRPGWCRLHCPDRIREVPLSKETFVWRYRRISLNRN